MCGDWCNLSLFYTYLVNNMEFSQGLIDCSHTKCDKFLKSKNDMMHKILPEILFGCGWQCPVTSHDPCTPAAVGWSKWLSRVSLTRPSLRSVFNQQLPPWHFWPNENSGSCVAWKYALIAITKFEEAWKYAKRQHTHNIAHKNSQRWRGVMTWLCIEKSTTRQGG